MQHNNEPIRGSRASQGDDTLIETYIAVYVNDELSTLQRILEGDKIAIRIEQREDEERSIDWKEVFVREPVTEEEEEESH